MEDTNYKNPSPSQSNGEWKKSIREEFLGLQKCIGEKFLDPCQNIYPCGAPRTPCGVVPLDPG